MRHPLCSGALLLLLALPASLGAPAALAQPSQGAAPAQAPSRNITVTIPQPLTIQLNQTTGQAPANASQGTEYWPAVWGVRLKITDSLLALFSLLLLIAVCGLWRSTHRSWRIARSQFDAVHRPHITVRSFETVGAGPGNENLSVAFFYVNTGDAPAVITEIGTALTGSENLAGLTFDSRKIVSTTLASGEKGRFQVENFTAYIARPLDDRAAAAAGGAVHLVGYVRYRDRAGRERETGFCRTFLADGRRWIKPAQSEYEYQD